MCMWDEAWGGEVRNKMMIKEIAGCSKFCFLPYNSLIKKDLFLTSSPVTGDNSDAKYEE